MKQIDSDTTNKYGGAVLATLWEIITHHQELMLFQLTCTSFPMSVNHNLGDTAQISTTQKLIQQNEIFIICCY